MSKLFVYACSFGKYGTTATDNHVWTDEKSFGDIIAKRKNLQLVNYSQPGASNQIIFKNFINTMNEITEDDITIVQWSHICRYTTTDNLTIMSHSVDSSDKEFAKLAKVYYQHFYDEMLNLSTIVGLTKYIKSVTKGKVYVSCVEYPDVLKSANERLYKDAEFDAFDGKGLHGYLSSFNNRDVYFSCMHPSELGHIHVAESYIKIMD